MEIFLMEICRVFSGEIYFYIIPILTELMP